jgi:hypothetical protein
MSLFIQQSRVDTETLLSLNEKYFLSWERRFLLLAPCLSQFSSLITIEVEMTIKLPDDQTLWFRNLPPATGDEKSQVEYQKSKIGPETELFIDPLTGLVIPIPIIKKEGQ